MKLNIQIWGLLLLLFSSFLPTENLQNHIFIFCISSVRKNATFKVLVAELKTKSEKGYAHPLTEFVQPAIFPYDHRILVQ
jgi:hypothetical protein